MLSFKLDDIKFIVDCHFLICFGAVDLHELEMPKSYVTTMLPSIHTVYFMSLLRAVHCEKRMKDERVRSPSSHAEWLCGQLEASLQSGQREFSSDIQRV